MIGKRLMWVAWPAFLVAAVLEMLVFAFFDPSELHWSGSSLGWTREAVYTVSFFLFWALTMVSSGLTTMLSMSPFEVNRCPFPVDNRPLNCTKTGGC